MKFCSILVYFLPIESDIRGLENFDYLADTTDDRLSYHALRGQDETS